MDAGTGEGYTDADHPALAHQLFASYARATRVRILASVVGREGLTSIDRQYLDFGDRFEAALVKQTRPRDLDESMAAGWEVLSLLPIGELARLSDAQIAQYLSGGTHGGPGS